MSAFRSLAPSIQQDDSSASSPNKYPSESNSATTGSTSGRGNSAGGDRGSGSGGDGKDGNPRKRRTAGSVSTMACTLCRQARQRVRSLISALLNYVLICCLLFTTLVFLVRANADLLTCFCLSSVMAIDPIAVVDVPYVNWSVSTSLIPKHTKTISFGKSESFGKTTPPFRTETGK